MASIYLTRHRRIAQKALKTCATPNKEEKVSGWLIALIVIGVFIFGIAADVHTTIAAIIAQ